MNNSNGHGNGNGMVFHTMHMSILFFLFNLILSDYNVTCGYVSMSCVDDTTWITDWDADWAFWRTTGGFPYFMSAIESYHNNGKEDRLFQFRYCVPSSTAYRLIDGMSEQPTSSVTTAWDAEWQLECEPNNEKSAFVSLYSRHDNGKEDRIFRAECASLSGLSLADCAWTSDYVNDWDDPFSYECSNDGVVAGIYSKHDNDKEDRRYKIKCCRFYE